MYLTQLTCLLRMHRVSYKHLDILTVGQAK